MAWNPKWQDGEFDLKAGDTMTAAELNGAIDEVCPPIGAVLPWAKSFTGAQSIPVGFVECNGQTLSDAASPYNGQTIPNLNGSGGGTERFIRGSTTSGTTGGAATLDTTHSHSVNTDQTTNVRSGAGLSVCPLDPTSDTQGGALSIIPSNYTVVFILRVK